jgi:carboxymethylenebutenolidase
MNKVLLFVACTLVLSNCQNSTQPCCQVENSATMAFASFASAAEFRNAHDLVPSTDTIFAGKMVRFAVANSDSANAYLVRPDVPTQRYLLLFHEWWGLNANTKHEAEIWANELGVNVLALDLYDGKVATTADEAGKYMQSCNETRARAIIGAAAVYAGPLADFRTCGWCFGGGWSLQATLELGQRAKGCVMYYGMPEKNLDKLKGLNCKVLFIHASQDKWINNDVVAEFEQNMTKAGKSLRVDRYDADHAFANPSGQRYNEAAAKAANSGAKAFLKGL